MTAGDARPREHPSPDRDRVRLEALLLALAAGPAAWIVQLVAGYALASRGCRPGDAPRAAPPAGGWGGEHGLLLAINLTCLAAALAGGMIAVEAWRRSRREKPGAAAATLEVGEGRTRFLAACGILAAGAFAVAIVFDTAWPLFIGACWRFT